jgi:2-dehydro-3-deoxygalactonokinase
VVTKPFIAVDWGTSSRRIYRIDGDRVTATERDDLGAARLTANDYAGEVEALRARLGDLPMLLAGMAGSDIGWRKVPYVETPARLDDLAASLRWIDDRTAIVPGVCSRDGGRVDVMRGEEVQFLGAVAAGLVSGDGLLCQPGTHCKWAELQGGAIARFTTAMTGELFALLSSKGLLARQLAGVAGPGPAFREGVAEGARRDLAASLFTVRARGVLDLLEEADAASFASGVLIGADVAPRIGAGQEVHLVSDPELGSLYVAAIETLGGTVRRVDSQAAFVAGISQVWAMAS